MHGYFIAQNVIKINFIQISKNLFWIHDQFNYTGNIHVVANAILYFRFYLAAGITGRFDGCVV